MNIAIILKTSQSIEMNSSSSYLIGAVIVLFVFGYLLYTLVKPEKF